MLMNKKTSYRSDKDGLELKYDDCQMLVFFVQTLQGNEMLAQVRLEKHELEFLRDFINSVLDDMK